MNNATINVVCYKWKTLANGENPLMLRVTKDGKAKYQSLGISVNPKFWNFKKNEPKPKCPNFEQIQKIILDKKLEIQRKMLEIRAEQKEYIATTLLIKEKHQSFTVYGGPYVLSMDRTNWQFGSFDINALVIGVTYKGGAFPILFRLLPKRGNSNTKERIQIMDRFIRLFGKSNIKCLVADREFVGQDWLGYLNRERIPYHLRIRENFWVKDPRTGKEFKAWWMFNHLKYGQSEYQMRIYYVNGQLCYLSGARLKNQDGKVELQIVVSYNKPEEAISSCKERWQIETAFRAMKTSGFNIEDTHLANIDRIEKLFAVMTIAFVWAIYSGNLQGYLH